MEKQKKISDAKRIAFGLLIGRIWGGLFVSGGALRVIRRVKYPECYNSICYNSKKTLSKVSPYYTRTPLVDNAKNPIDILELGKAMILKDAHQTGKWFPFDTSFHNIFVDSHRKISFHVSSFPICGLSLVVSTVLSSDRICFRRISPVFLNARLARGTTRLATHRNFQYH
jgi:hypothetical protein